MGVYPRGSGVYVEIQTKSLKDYQKERVFVCSPDLPKKYVFSLLKVQVTRFHGRGRFGNSLRSVVPVVSEPPWSLITTKNTETIRALESRTKL